MKIISLLLITFTISIYANEKIEVIGKSTFSKGECYLTFKRNKLKFYDVYIEGESQSVYANGKVVNEWNTFDYTELGEITTRFTLFGTKLKIRPNFNELVEITVKGSLRKPRAFTVKRTVKAGNVNKLVTSYDCRK